MSDVSIGILAISGLPCLVVLLVCIARVLNRRTASRERHHRPFDPSYQLSQTMNDPIIRSGGSGILLALVALSVSLSVQAASHATVTCQQQDEECIVWIS